MSVAQASWDALVSALTAARRVLLLAHVSPDADALGSALAIGLALHARGTQVVVSFGDDPFSVPPALRTLPGQDLIAPATDVKGPFDVAVAFDAASASRLGILEQAARDATVFACLDHHASNPGMGDVDVIDPTVPATAVLALDLLDRLGLPLTTDVAAALYAGLSTDTGSFRYAGTDAATHLMAARLHEAGIRHDLIARSMYDDEAFAAVRLLGAAVARARLDSDAVRGSGVVWTTLSRAEREEAGVALDQVERVIDLLRISSEAEVAVVLKQDDEGLWRASVRSKGALDVGAAMTAIGGGGHRYAAGATLGQDLEAAWDQVRGALEGHDRP